jgi:hypothetical protein
LHLLRNAVGVILVDQYPWTICEWYSAQTAVTNDVQKPLIITINAPTPMNLIRKEVFTDEDYKRNA